MTDNAKILAFVAKCENPKQLKTIIQNAKAKGESGVVDIAFERLIALVPAEKPGTIEYDFWRTINALELVLTDERQKTTRLSRTRQKIDRVGILRTIIDLTLNPKPSAGFKMLLERRMPQYTAEALVLRHSDTFDLEVLNAARARLEGAGVDLAALPN